MSGSAAPLGWVPPRRLRAVWLLSVLVHAALVFTWVQQPRPARTHHVPRMEVRIVPLVPGSRMNAAETAQLPPPADRPNPKARDLRDPEQRPARPAAISVSVQPAAPGAALLAAPAPAISETVDPQSVAAPVPSAQSSPTSPSPGEGGLRLDWTPPARSARAASAPTAREQALNDSRSNTQRPSAEARMAQNVGNGSLQEEALGDGRRRFRKGARCADVYRTHIAQLNPFDARLRDIQVAKPCD